MTSIGFAILEYFTQCLDPKYPNQNWVLSSRDAEVLKRLYSWEEGFITEEDLAKEMGLPIRKIKRLRRRTLKRVKAAAEQGRNPAHKIIRIIDRYIRKDERNQVHKVIVRLWRNEMPEVPAFKIIRLLAELYFTERKDILATYRYYFNWQKRGFVERRPLQKRLRFWNEERLKEQLLESTIWFEQVKRWKKEDFNGKLPKRKVNADDRYHSGQIFSQKCNNLIQYESGVEKEFIERLEANPSVIHYLEQPVTISYTRNGKDYKYTPDFAILIDDGRCLIAEVKHSSAYMLDARVHRRMEALIEFCEKNGMGLLLTNGRHSLGYLIDYPITEGLEQVFREKLNERGGRTIFRNECQDLLLQYRARLIELLALVLKNNWGLYPYPFKLTPKNNHSIFREKIVNELYKRNSIKKLQKK